jgi:hypothetical protein
MRSTDADPTRRGRTTTQAGDWQAEAD